MDKKGEHEWDALFLDSPTTGCYIISVFFVCRFSTLAAAAACHECVAISQKKEPWWKKRKHWATVASAAPARMQLMRCSFLRPPPAPHACRLRRPGGRLMLILFLKKMSGLSLGRSIWVLLKLGSRFFN